MSRLYLIRHGKPASVWGGGDEDPGLDVTGQIQAKAARDILLALPPEERPSRVVTSPLRRCRETALPTARALGVELEIDTAVGEIPTPVSLSAAERPAWLRQAFEGRWSEVVGDLDYEAWRHAVARSLVPRGGTAVFSHYVAINAVLSVLDGDDRVLVFQPDHTSITVLDTDGERLSLVRLGTEAATSVL